MKHTILLISIPILLTVVTYPAQSQRTYITRKGKLVANALDGDSLKTYEFKNINVLLDYDRAELVINFKLDDSLDDQIPSNRFFYDFDVAIRARLSLTNIDTEPHPDQQFSIKGHIVYDEAGYFMNGNGTLEHNDDGSEYMSCLLTLRIDLVDEKQLFLESMGQVESFFLFQNVLNRDVLNEWEKVGY